MNTKPKLPAYIVNVNNLLTGKQKPSRPFANLSLSVARNAAFSYVQQLLTERGQYELLDVTISLVEYERSIIPNPCTVIATVSHQRTSSCTGAYTLPVEEQTEGLAKEKKYYQTNGYLIDFSQSEEIAA